MSTIADTEKQGEELATKAVEAARVALEHAAECLGLLGGACMFGNGLKVAALAGQAECVAMEVKVQKLLPMVHQHFHANDRGDAA